MNFFSRHAYLLGICCIAISGCSEAKKVSNPSTLEYRIVPSAQRVLPDQSFTHFSATPQTVQLYAVRGESETIQIAVNSAPSSSLLVTPNAGLKKHGVSVRAFLAQSMTVSQPSPGGGRGRYFDPLLPVSHAVVEKDVLPLLVVDLKISRTAPVGVQVGTLTITSTIHDSSGRKKSVRVRIPLKISISTTQLPQVPYFESSVGTSDEQIARMEGVENGSVELARKRNQYIQELASARLTTADIPVPESVVTKFTEFSKSPASQQLEEAIGVPGVKGFRVPIYITHPYSDPLAGDSEAAKKYIINTAAFMRSIGAVEPIYVYIKDEPAPSDYDDVRAIGEIVDELGDGVVDHLVTTQPTKELVGSVDIWGVAITNRVSKVDIRQAHTRGERYWIYPSIATHPPYPSLFIDDPRPGPRMIGWLMHSYGADGFLYYDATHWHEESDPWTQPRTWINPDGAVGNGDGVLLYPGKPFGLQSPAPSIRLLQLRDGLEDAEVLEKLRATQPGFVSRQIAKLAPTFTNFETDPQKIEAAHREIVLASARRVIAS